MVAYVVEEALEPQARLVPVISNLVAKNRRIWRDSSLCYPMCLSQKAMGMSLCSIKQRSPGLAV